MQRVLGKMVWTFSVHTATDIPLSTWFVTNGSVMNMVCYESGVF